MSFGFSIGDFVLLTQLAYRIVQNSRQASGAYSDLTREVTSLHIVLQRLELEVSSPTSVINRINDGRRGELKTIIGGCEKQLKVLDQVLTKYNGLSEETRRTTKLWQKIQFGNGKMKDLGKIRQELATYTAAITLFLNLLSMGSQGRVEEHMENHGAEMRELRASLNWITASLQASSSDREGSILTTYADDDKKIWKEFRRELLGEGFSSSTLRKNKDIIREYVLELGARGALDTPTTDTSSVVADSEERQDVEEPDAILKDDSADSSSEDENAEQKQPLKSTPPGSTQSSDRSSFSLPLTTPAVQNTQPASLEEVEELDATLEDCSADSSAEPGKLDQVHTRKFVYLGPTYSFGQNSFSLSPTVQNPQPASLEEVEDEDFRPGAHPNCISVDFPGDAEPAEIPKPPPAESLLSSGRVPGESAMKADSSDEDFNDGDSLDAGTWYSDQDASDENSSGGESMRIQYRGTTFKDVIKQFGFDPSIVDGSTTTNFADSNCDSATYTPSSQFFTSSYSSTNSIDSQDESNRFHVWNSPPPLKTFFSPDFAGAMKQFHDAPYHSHERRRTKSNTTQAGFDRKASNERSRRRHQLVDYRAGGWI